MVSHTTCNFCAYVHGAVHRVLVYSFKQLHTCVWISLCTHKLCTYVYGAVHYVLVYGSEQQRTCTWASLFIQAHKLSFVQKLFFCFLLFHLLFLVCFVFFSFEPFFI